MHLFKPELCVICLRYQGLVYLNKFIVKMGKIRQYQLEVILRSLSKMK